MLIVAPDEEVDGYRGGPYQRTDDCRDGTAPRQLTLSGRTVGLEQRSVCGSLDGQEVGEPETVQHSERRGNTIDETFMRL